MPLSRERGYKIVIINDMIIRSERSQTDERAESDRKNLMPLSLSTSSRRKAAGAPRRQLNGRATLLGVEGKRPPPSPPLPDSRSAS